MNKKSLTLKRKLLSNVKTKWKIFFSIFSGLLRISELYFRFVERLFEHDFSFMAQCAMAGVVHSEPEPRNLLENYLDINEIK